MPIKPGKYIHLKGNEYEVLGTATHSETLEKMVIYRALSGDGGAVRGDADGEVQDAGVGEITTRKQGDLTMNILFGNTYKAKKVPGRRTHGNEEPHL